MTAVEVAVKALIDLSNNTKIEPSVRCDAARALAGVNIDGTPVFAGYDDEGRLTPPSTVG